MFLVSKESGMKDYLLECEDNYTSNESLEFSTKKLAKYLKEQKIKSKDFSPSVYNSYLQYEKETNEHSKPRFIGALAKNWNIEYSKENFVKMMNGEKFFADAKMKEFEPNIKFKKTEKFTNNVDNKVNSVSFVSTYDKSISIEYIRNKKSKKVIDKVKKETNDEMVKIIAKKVKPSNKKAEYKNFDPSKTEIIACGFTHYESRDYDPELHEHLEVANYAKFYFHKIDKFGNKLIDEKGQYIYDEKILAIDPEQIFKEQLELSQIHDTIFYSKMKEQGFKFERVENDNISTQRLIGYSDKQCEQLSSRNNEIEDFKRSLDGKVFSSKKQEIEYIEKMKRATAEKKTTKNANEVIDKIRDKISTVINKDDGKSIDSEQSQAFQEYEKLDIKKVLNNCGFETNGVIDKTKLRTTILNDLKFTGNFTNINDLDKEVEKTIKKLEHKSNGLNRIVELGNGKITTLKVILNERKAIENFNNLAKKSNNLTNEVMEERKDFIKHFVEDYKKTHGFYLRESQIVAIEKTLLTNKAFSIVIGDAGTGKTTSVELALNSFYESKGIKTIGISTSQKATNELKQAGVKELLNSTVFINKAFDKAGNINQKFLEQNKNSVLMLDEAGMLSAEHYNKILEFGLKSNSKIVFVGDNKQLKSVGYGNTFTEILKKSAIEDISRLDEVVRQKNEVALNIANSYRDKKIEKAIDLMEQNNLLFKGDKSRDLANSLVEEYLKDTNTNKIVICYKNDEIDYLNDEIRTKIIEEELNKKAVNPEYKPSIDIDNQVSISVSRKSGTRTISRERNFAIGDNIVFSENFKKEISNSDIGKITNIEKRKNGSFDISVEIKEDGKTKQVKFNSNEYNKFNHAFAVSTYKSQGQSIDNVYILGDKNTNHNREYVNFSRHKEQVKFFIKKDELNSYIENAKKEQIKETTLNDAKAEKAYNHAMVELSNSINIPIEVKSKIDKFNYLDQVKNKKAIEMEKVAKQEKMVEIKPINTVKIEPIKEVDIDEKRRKIDEYANKLAMDLANKQVKKSKGLSL